LSITNIHNPEDVVYLRPEVKMEPLICRWFAWSHLLSPVQLAMHITYRILPLLQSFVTNPSVHVSANSDPKMYGGPFVSLRQEDVEQVKELIAITTRNCAKLMTMAQDFRRFDNLLQEKASGYSLNDFYAELPASLAGLVELLYDTYHHPSMRFFESMVYDEHLTEHTHEIFLQEVAESDRHFFMSTPRLPTPDSLSFAMPFSDERLDALASTRTRPGSFSQLARLFDVSEAQIPTFRSFFTSQPPACKDGANYTGDGVRMRYFGHACVLFQSDGTSVLFDPFVSIEPGADARFTINDLPDFIDYVVITHSHQDHFSLEMLIQLRHRIGRVLVPANNSGNITDPSMKLNLMELGFKNVDVLDVLDQVALPNGHILSLPFTGEHADLSIYSKQAVALSMAGRKFMFLIDSDGRDPILYRKLMRRVGAIDALFIGMECHGAPLNWLYEPVLGKPVNRRNNESRRLSGADNERAQKILDEIKAPQVFVYAMGQEPWMKYVMGLQYEPDSVQLTESNKFLEQCAQAGVQAERLYISREVTYGAVTEAAPLPQDALRA
jgi:L-ascorbate metabolism protein UlaG (beta-lactamase superfamily)